MLLHEKDEGIVLKSIDYKDQQKIITLFTLNRGIISLIVKGINRKRTHLLTLASPLTHAEYHFSIRRSDLYTFQDGSPLNTHYQLRENLNHLQTAVSFAEALLSSQFPGKPAPALYQLLLVYLKYLPRFPDPSPLRASFLLKLLKHEGHLSVADQCSHCDAPPSHFSMGEGLCRAHAPSYATPLSQEQWTTLALLADARAIPQLQGLNLEPELAQKIEKFFKERI